MSRGAGSQILDGLRLALHVMRSHKMRSGLVVLGVAIGVATLMGMVTILLGLGKKISEDIRSSDNVVIYLSKFDLLVGGDPRELAHRPELELDDLEAIRNELPSVSLADFQQQPQWRTILRYEGEKTGLVAVLGATGHFPLVFNIPLQLGRNLTLQEEERRAKVAVLGAGPSGDLFPNLDPIGKTIRIRGEPFIVVGVYRERKHLFGGMADDYVVVPASTFRKEWGDEDDQVIIAAVPREGVPIQVAMDDITALMRQRHGLRPGEEDDFAVSSAEAVEELVQKVTGPVGLVLAVIASIGLMVGGIGVMAIMLVSVTERTAEIGVRKSLGARRVDILYQFLIEASTLTGIGGLVGVAVGIGVAEIASALLRMPSLVSPTWTAAAVMFSAGIGLVFGLYPALRAARLDPIDAMRRE